MKSLEENNLVSQFPPEISSILFKFIYTMITPLPDLDLEETVLITAPQHSLGFDQHLCSVL